MINAAAPASIPYRTQSGAETTRTCGAACLSMVYASFGKEVSQEEIWQAIARPNKFGVVSSTTHLMAKDALSRGFDAMAIQARHPLQVLRICRRHKIRAVLNHRLKSDSSAGHYSVLVDIDDESVVLHDPLLGASRRLTYSELLELWLPFSANSEILGNVLIAVAQTEPSSEAVCQSCRTPLAPSIPCPNCQKTVGLRPPAVLNCLNDACIARMWNCFCCPECDSLSTIHSHAAAKGAPQLRPTAARLQSPVPASDLDTGKLFDEIDKFIKHVLTLPAASNPEVGKQLDQIAANKEKFKVAYSEHLARSEKIRDQLNAALKAHQAEKEAQLKKMEEAETPAPPLDGEALGRALLQNLGFSRQE